MMNQQTRRLSKMPEEVRAEISPWFIEKQAIQEELSEKIEKLDDKAKYVNSNLKVKLIRTEHQTGYMLQVGHEILFPKKFLFLCPNTLSVAYLASVFVCFDIIIHRTTVSTMEHKNRDI